jgi:hypothetical protein
MLERRAPQDTAGIWAAYIAGIHEFNGRFHVVKTDRKADAKLAHLGAMLAGIQNQAVSSAPVGTDRRDVVCQWIDRLRDHLKDAKD